MKKMKSVPLNEALYNYILDKFVPENPLIDDLIKETETLNIPLIQISPDQGRFLYLLCKMIKAKDALEIGTLTGFSGIHIATGLIPGGKLVTVELLKSHAEIAKKFFKKAGVADRIEVIVSQALDYMKKLVEGEKKFDLIFIDADKTNYPNYFEQALKLSHSGTVIIFDNMIKDGRVVEDPGDDKDLKAIQLTNEIISKNDSVESLLFPIGDGFTVSVVK